MMRRNHTFLSIRLAHLSDSHGNEGRTFSIRMALNVARYSLPPMAISPCPNRIIRIVIKISDHLKFFRTCLVNGISWVAGSKFDDVIWKFFANLFKDTAGDKARGHGLWDEFSFANQIKHHGANRFSHILTDGKIKI